MTEFKNNSLVVVVLVVVTLLSYSLVSIYVPDSQALKVLEYWGTLILGAYFGHAYTVYGLNGKKRTDQKQ